MADVKEIRYEVTGVDKGAVATFGRVKSAIGEVERSYAGLAKLFVRGAIAGTAVSVFGQMVREVREAEQIGMRFNAVLRATGNTAGFTRAQLAGMADDISSNTIFDDEAAKQAMSNLIKFQNIHGEVFREAMQLSADYAAMTGVDMASASQAVGRALQSPVLGLRALQMELGRLTPEQERHIKLLMQQGRLAEAQAVVLDFLRGKLKGTAEEMNKGLNGALANLTKNWNDMLKAMGRGASGGLVTDAIGVMAEKLKQIQRVFEADNWQERAREFFQYFSPTARPAEWDAAKSARTATGVIGGLPRPPQAKTEEQLDAEKRAEESRLRGLKEAAELQKRWASDTRRDAERLAEHQMRHLGEQWAEKQKLIEADKENEYKSMALRFDERQDLEIALGQMRLREYHAAEKKIQQANDDTRKYNLEAEKRLAEEQNQFAIQAARNLQSELSGAIYDVLDRRTDSLGERFSQMLKRMQAELIASKLNGFLFGDFGKTGELGGLAGSVISRGVGALFPGSQVYPEDEFATGGSFIVGGNGGTDTTPVRFKATRGERVTIETPEQQRAGRGGGVTVNLNFALGVQQTVRAEIAALMPQITQGVTAGVYDTRSRLPAGSQP